jgi:hypothetical protein
MKSFMRINASLALGLAVLPLWLQSCSAESNRPTDTIAEVVGSNHEVSFAFNCRSKQLKPSQSFVVDTKKAGISVDSWYSQEELVKALARSQYQGYEMSGLWYDGDKTCDELLANEKLIASVKSKIRDGTLTIEELQQVAGTEFSGPVDRVTGQGDGHVDGTEVFEYTTFTNDSLPGMYASVDKDGIVLKLTPRIKSLNTKGDHD